MFSTISSSSSSSLLLQLQFPLSSFSLVTAATTISKRHALVSVAGSNRSAAQFRSIPEGSSSSATTSSTSTSSNENESSYSSQSSPNSTLTPSNTMMSYVSVGANTALGTDMQTSSINSGSNTTASSTSTTTAVAGKMSPEEASALQAAATQLMRFRIAKPEQFYFSRGDSICRLCNEFVPEKNVKFHLVGAGPRGPSTHMGREIILDSLFYYAKLGYDPRQVMRSWSYTLLSAQQYVRLPHLFPRRRKTNNTRSSSKKMEEEKSSSASASSSSSTQESANLENNINNKSFAGFERAFKSTFSYCPSSTQELFSNKSNNNNNNDNNNNNNKIPSDFDPCDLEARAMKVNQLLHGFSKLGILDVAISPHSDVARTNAEMRMAVKRRVAFERLECIGDNAWGSNLSGRMLLVFPDKRWAHCNMHHSYNTFRDLAETNTNLERMFDLLQLTSLLPPASKSVVGDGKIKADIFEAILGELDMVLYAYESNVWTTEEYTEINDEHLAHVCLMIRHVLNEIYDLTLLCLLFLLAEHAVPIARELALHQLMLGGIASSPTTSSSVSGVSCLKPALDAGDSIRTRRPKYHSNFIPTFNLPAKRNLFEESISMKSLLLRESRNRNRNTNQNIIFSKVALHSTPRATYTVQWNDFTSSLNSLENSDDISVDYFSSFHNNINNNKKNLRDSQHYHHDHHQDLQIQQHHEEEINLALLSSNVMLSLSSSPSPSSIVDLSSSSDKKTTITLPIYPELIISDSSSIKKDAKKSTTTTSGSQQQQETRISSQQQQHEGTSPFLQSLTLSSSSSSSQYRNSCPFKMLSKYPPHVYNPYNMDDETWMSRWMDSESGRERDEVREIFDEDVADSVNVVLAQFEATAAMRRDKEISFSSVSKDQKNQENQEKQEQQEQQEQKEVERLSIRYENPSTLYERFADAAVDILEDQQQQQDQEQQHKQHKQQQHKQKSSDTEKFYNFDNKAVTELPSPHQVPGISREVLQLIHPFRNGVTVGSEGASFSALSSTIAAVSTETMRHGEKQIIRNRRRMSSFASEDVEESEKDNINAENTSSSISQSSSSSTTPAGATTVTGDINIDEIKRRNLAKRRTY